MGRKKTPQPPRRQLPYEGEPEEPMTEADRAYAHAVEVCDRIIRELDEELEGRKRHGKENDSSDELLGREAGHVSDAGGSGGADRL